MDDGDFLFAVYALMIGFLAGFFLGTVIVTDTYRPEAVSRGFALYCPDDGVFAWKGECDAD